MTGREGLGCRRWPVPAHAPGTLGHCDIVDLEPGRDVASLRVANDGTVKVWEAASGRLPRNL